MIRDNWREKYVNEILATAGPEFTTLVKLHNEVAKATFKFFDTKHMQYIPVPETTSSASSPMEPGSDSSPVRAQIGNRSVLLTDSAQFHLECACRSCGEGCFYYGHSFRDEEPDVRHLSQFSHAEAEITGTLEDVKKLVEKYVKYITESIWNNAREHLDDIPGIKDRISALLEPGRSFKSISFEDACKLLEGHEDALTECGNGQFRISPAGETILLEKSGEFLWLENWDKMTVPFYQAVNRENGIALNADLLFGIGEVVGAGQRHVGADELEYSLKEHGLSGDDYQWYIEMKRQYPLKTAGFGMGVERYLLWLLGIKDIRSVELFPRNRLQSGII